MAGELPFSVCYLTCIPFRQSRGVQGSDPECNASALRKGEKFFEEL